jgi:hypothetical protein
VTEQQKIIIKPGGGLANQMFQLMLATEIKRRSETDVDITGYNLPEWGLLCEQSNDLMNAPEVLLGSHTVDLDKVAYLLRSRIIQTVHITGLGMRIEYYSSPGLYRNIFKNSPPATSLQHDESIMIHVRGGDILSGRHPSYFPMSFAFYDKIIEDTGLEPVFIGQFDKSEYIDALQNRFCGAKFIFNNNRLEDFQILRNSTNVVLSTSSFAWLATWLSETAENIHMPVCGLFEPTSRRVNLLPVGDSRYHFYRVPFPTKAKRRDIDVVQWATNEDGVAKMSPADMAKLILPPMIPELTDQPEAKPLMKRWEQLARKERDKWISYILHRNEDADGAR